MGKWDGALRLGREVGPEGRARYLSWKLGKVRFIINQPLVL